MQLGWASQWPVTFETRSLHEMVCQAVRSPGCKKPHLAPREQRPSMSHSHGVSPLDAYLRMNLAMPSEATAFLLPAAVANGAGSLC